MKENKNEIQINIQELFLRYAGSMFNLLKSEFTTQLEISQQDRVFYDLLDFISKRYKNKNFRSLTTKDYWEDGSPMRRTILSIGYGTHYLKYNNKYIEVVLEKGEHAHNASLRLTILGRDASLLVKLINEISNKNKLKNELEVYKFKSGDWMYIKCQKKRPLSSVFLKEEIKQRLLSQLSSFKSREDWYIKNGIPYQLGILLHGGSGTGKSSLARAIAGLLNYNIYYLPVSKLTDIETAMEELPNNSLVIIEDIDCNSGTHSRGGENNLDDSENKENENKDKAAQDISFAESLSKVFSDTSGLLNSIDGIMSSHGRILVATTNYIEKLDKAFLRPGRFDLKLEIGYVDEEILKLFFGRHFADYKLDNKFKIKPRVTVAMLQQYLLEGMDAEQIAGLIGE